MSAKLMGLVWDHDLPRSERDVLLAFADHADHDGENARPGVGLLAWKTGLSEREVEYALAWLRQRGALVQTAGRRPGRATTYRIMLDALPLKTPYRAKAARGAPIQAAAVAPIKAQTEGDMAQTDVPNGAPQGAPEPSTEPSVEPSGVRAAPSARRPRDLTPAQEVRAVAREAREVWRRARSAVGPAGARFTDPAAMRSLDRAVGRAMARPGVTYADVATGLRRAAADPSSNPWYADEWAARIAAEREALEHTERLLRERSAERPRGMHAIGDAVRAVAGATAAP